jgi:hypothetical protein
MMLLAFIAAGLVLTDLRSRLSLENLEAILYLKYNKRLWNKRTVGKVYRLLNANNSSNNANDD